MDHVSDLADLEQLWERNREKFIPEQPVREPATLYMKNSMMADLFDALRATEADVLAADALTEALMQLQRLGFDGPDYRIKINAMLKARMTEDENLIALSVENQRCIIGRSLYAACAVVPAEWGVRSKTFEGAIAAVQRIVKRHAKAPNAITEY